MFFFFKQKTAYEMRISDWSSDVCSSDLVYAKEERASLRPMIVYFHGGLFNCGKVEDAAAIAAALSAVTVVACVDYPLAPRLHFPATVEVAFEALLWAADRKRVV